MPLGSLEIFDILNSLDSLDNFDSFSIWGSLDIFDILNSLIYSIYSKGGMFFNINIFQPLYFVTLNFSIFNTNNFLTLFLVEISKYFKKNCVKKWENNSVKKY